MHVLHERSSAAAIQARFVAAAFVGDGSARRTLAGAIAGSDTPDTRPVDVAVFRDDLLVPDVAAGGFEEFRRRSARRSSCRSGAGTSRPSRKHRRQVERLHVDRELMLAELDDVLAVDEQFLPVLELPHCVFADRLQAALDVVDLHRVVEFGELFDDVADLLDHQVRGEVAVDLVDRLQACRPGS